MKDKNLPDDNNSKSLEKLTQEINRIIEELEKKEDIKNSLDDYQKLIQLNNIIEKKFQRKSRSISQNIKEKIDNITSLYFIPSLFQSKSNTFFFKKIFKKTEIFRFNFSYELWTFFWWEKNKVQDFD